MTCLPEGAVNRATRHADRRVVTGPMELSLLRSHPPGGAGGAGGPRGPGGPVRCLPGRGSGRRLAGTAQWAGTGTGTGPAPSARRTAGRCGLRNVGGSEKAERRFVRAGSRRRTSGPENEEHR
jgi:hypothetical protein